MCGRFITYRSARVNGNPLVPVTSAGNMWPCVAQRREDHAPLRQLDQSPVTLNPAVVPSSSCRAPLRHSANLTQHSAHNSPRVGDSVTLHRVTRPDTPRLVQSWTAHSLGSQQVSATRPEGFQALSSGNERGHNLCSIQNETAINAKKGKGNSRPISPALVCAAGRSLLFPADVSPSTSCSSLSTCLTSDDSATMTSKNTPYKPSSDVMMLNAQATSAYSNIHRQIVDEICSPRPSFCPTGPVNTQGSNSDAVVAQQDEVWRCEKAGSWTASRTQRNSTDNLERTLAMFQLETPPEIDNGIHSLVVGLQADDQTSSVSGDTSWTHDDGVIYDDVFDWVEKSMDNQQHDRETSSPRIGAKEPAAVRTNASTLATVFQEDPVPSNMSRARNNVGVCTSHTSDAWPANCEFAAGCSKAAPGKPARPTAIPVKAMDRSANDSPRRANDPSRPAPLTAAPQAAGLICRHPSPNANRSSQEPAPAKSLLSPEGSTSPSIHARVIGLQADPTPKIIFKISAGLHVSASYTLGIDSKMDTSSLAPAHAKSLWSPDGSIFVKSPAFAPISNRC